MADDRFKLIARRDDGAYLIEVAGSPCALTVGDDGDGGTGIWANSLDAIAARGGWDDASGDLPTEVLEAVEAFIAVPGWCGLEAD